MDIHLKDLYIKHVQYNELKEANVLDHFYASFQP